MTQPGFFEIYPAARPALPAGPYQATSESDLAAVPPPGTDGAIPVDPSQFGVHIDAPRYTMPPDQILSTFPPAGSRGDWRERLPQIVLKRRTLPWERNPDPAILDNPEPWLALVVLADGEGLLSTDVDVSQCVTPGLDLGPDADVATGRYLEVTDDIVAKVFPCRDELDLLCHVRKVDLHDTELAMGDDDGYLAVVLANRLPQPGPPPTTGGEPQPQKYTAYLINLERQLPELLATEPDPVYHFDATINLVRAEFLAAAPEATLDQIAMNLGPGRRAALGPVEAGESAAPPHPTSVVAGGSQVVPYGTAHGLETGTAAWATGPPKAGSRIADDLSIAGAYRSGLNKGVLPFTQRYRFPVLVSWDFTCTGTGGFEYLMNKLEVGLLGTLDPAPASQVLPEVAPTGHVGLPHLTRHGDPVTSWFRGPLGPQPTVRTGPVDGALAIAHTSDQLRKVTPDGWEDISLAAVFEIGRLLALSKPTLVAALMDWRRELFGAARARDLADALAGKVIDSLGAGIIGSRSSLEALVRTHLVGAFTAVDPSGPDTAGWGPRAREVTPPRVPAALFDVSGDAVLTGLGLDLAATRAQIAAAGVDGLGAVPLTVAPWSSKPLSSDRAALARVTGRLDDRVARLAVDSLKIVDSKATRKFDDLDRMISRARRKER